METIVLIPNFNGREHLRECLESLRLQTYRDFLAVVVDNGSTDGSVEFIKNNFPEVVMIENKENMGFTPAINQGIREALHAYEPAYIALLNNDTKASPEWLGALAQAITSENNIAAVASNMRYYDRPDIINSQGATSNFIGIGKDINTDLPAASAPAPEKYILAPCFGACLVNAKTLFRIGLPDKRYVSYYEDLDWGWRANTLGYKVIFEEKALILHKGSATWKEFPRKKTYLCLRNSLCTIIKNYSAKRLALALPVLVGYYLLFIFAHLANVNSKNYRIQRIKKSFPLRERLSFARIPLESIAWNVKNLQRSLAMRKNIRSNKLYTFIPKK